MPVSRDPQKYYFRAPDKEKIKAFLWWLITGSSVFSVFYGGANRLCLDNDRAFRLYFDIELSVPFIPEMIYFYVSVIVLIYLPLFRLKLSDLELVCQRILLATVISGIVFYMLPTSPAYMRPESAKSFSVLFKYLYAVDNPCNLFPSLHISYSSLLVLSLVKDSPILVKVGLICWLVLIYISVIVTYQHHLVDIAGGIFVTWLCHRLIRP
ncbi:MAG: phosphatase PAP2 family protein [Spirochaetota bacterium]|nr:phosphatase PAP2 family protein [Spirochaetota bacterium]